MLSRFSAASDAPLLNTFYIYFTKSFKLIVNIEGGKHMKLMRLIKGFFFRDSLAAKFSDKLKPMQYNIL